MSRLSGSVSAVLRPIGVAALLVLGLVASLPEPAAAASPGVWTVTEASGETLVRRNGGNWQPLAVGAHTPPGSEIRTGPDGVLTIARGGDRVTFSPGSQALIPSLSPGNQALTSSLETAARGFGGASANGAVPAALTTGGDAAAPATSPSLIQRAGVLLFDMETRESRDFVIETPVLAAAVKGTTFTVSVEDDQSLVNVAEGMVEVTALTSGLSVMVESGEMASVGTDDVASAPTVLDRQALLEEQSGTSEDGLTATLGETAVDVGEASDGFVGDDGSQTATLDLDGSDTLRSSEIDALQTSTSGSSGTGGDAQEADSTTNGKGATVTKL